MQCLIRVHPALAARSPELNRASCKAERQTSTKLFLKPGLQGYSETEWDMGEGRLNTFIADQQDSHERR